MLSKATNSSDVITEMLSETTKLLLFYALNKESLENGDTPLMIPVFSGNPAEIKGTAEWQNITFFTNELLNLPWIWYYSNYNGRCVVVGIAYLDYILQLGLMVHKDIQSFMNG